MENAKIPPLATPKPLNRSSHKLAGVITSWTAPGMQNFVTVDLGVSVPQIRDFAVLLGGLVCLFFWGFFNKATAYTPGRIFTQNTSNDVVPSKEMSVGVPMTIFYIWTLKFPKKPQFRGPILTTFLRPKTALTWGCSNIKLPLIVIVAP